MTGTPSEILSLAEIECLRCIAGHMIPASREYGMPGADDPDIVDDMVHSTTRDADDLKSLLALVEAEAGGSLVALTLPDQAALLERLRSSHPAAFVSVEAIVSRAYYRDDRVLTAIGMPARAPFPEGFQVERADLALLEPVKARGKIYRDAN